MNSWHFSGRLMASVLIVMNLLLLCNVRRGRSDLFFTLDKWDFGFSVG